MRDDFPGDPARNYAIPADNPFVGAAGADEIFALGLRNPWRPSFDRGLGDFYIADVGQTQWEEIDIGQKGANYGWPAFEGPGVFRAGRSPAERRSRRSTFMTTAWGNRSPAVMSIAAKRKRCRGNISSPTSSQGKVFTLRFDGTAWVATDRTSQIMTDVGFGEQSDRRSAKTRAAISI